jgi:hypothetical protein
MRVYRWIDRKSIHQISRQGLVGVALAERVCQQIKGKLIHQICQQDLAGLVLTEDGVSAHHREVDSSSLPARPSGACSLMRSICPIGQVMHNMPVKD